ncbi:hypothetical protein B0H13DRAFT_1881922 [Mycena leptocephala]|nr:hypothetical protein B0H13DRAFT_1881922 [Mycena leptocephala]
MSANPAHYNTADRVRFENYADSLRNFGAGLGPFPGPTPTGYCKFFCMGHKYAPVLEDYPHLLTSATQPNSNQGLHATGADISMSTAGLGIILDSQQKLFNLVLVINKNQQFAPSRPHLYYRSYFNRGYQHGGCARQGNHFGHGGRHLVVLMVLAMSVGNKAGDAESDTTSNAAIAGGLTDNEYDELMVVTNEDVLEEGEFDQDVDNGFNVAGGLNAN